MIGLKIVLTRAFLSLDKPGPDRLLSSWFIACKKGCPIVLKMRECFASFFMKNTFNINGRYKKKTIKFMGKFLNKSKRTKYWVSPVVTKLLRVYPYFILHYLFERLVDSDPECQTIWNNTKKMSADGPHRLQSLGFSSLLMKILKLKSMRSSLPYTS